MNKALAHQAPRGEVVTTAKSLANFSQCSKVKVKKHFAFRLQVLILLDIQIPAKKKKKKGGGHPTTIQESKAITVLGWSESCIKLHKLYTPEIFMSVSS